MRCGGGVMFAGCLGVNVLMGAVVVGLWVSVLCLGFPYKEDYLLGSRVCRGLHRLWVYPNQNSLRDAAWGMGDLGTLDFFLVPLCVGVGFLVGGFVRGWCLQDFFCAYSSA